MLWIKRNLFLAVGGLVAVASLAVGILYALGAISRNTALDEELEQNKATLTRLYAQVPFPATTNVDAAKREAGRLDAAVGRMRKFFVAPPVERVTGLGFRQFRDKLLADLRESARSAGMDTPGATYAFSFEEQRTRVDLDPTTFPVIPEQMVDVQAICGILIDGRVNPLVNIRRARASADDERSSHQSDYHSRALMTNAPMGVVISPYEVTFHCLSAELATVLQKLAGSPYGMVVKSIRVDTVEEKPAAAAGVGVGMGGRGRGTATATSGGRSGAGDRAVTLLNERRFEVMLLIYVVRAEDSRKAVARPGR